MNWFKRSFRAFKGGVSQAPRRHRLEFDCLEDRSVPTAAGIIAGSVFYDYNANGVFGGNDRAVAGVAVSLNGTTDLGTPVSLSTTTTAGGAYQFIKLEPGQYQVSSSPSQFPTTTGAPGVLGGDSTGNVVQNIVLDQGQVEANLRFAFSGVSLGVADISLRLFFNENIGDPATETPNKLLKNTADTIINNVGPAGTGRVVADGAAVPNETGTSSLAGTVFRDGGTTGVAGINMQITGVSKAGTPFVFTTTTDASGSYKFSNLPSAAYFIQVLPSADFRAAGSRVGSLGGSSVRADQLAPPILPTTATNGTGYNFNLASFSGSLDAGLASDAGGGTMGTFSDGVTNDPSIRGRLLNASSFDLEASFSGITGFVDVNGSIAPDGSFVLNPQTLRDVFGGGFPDGTYTVDLRATGSDGTVLTKSVSFTLISNAPTFLSAFPNITATNGGSLLLQLAGTFTDSDITNSVVTFNVMKGNTPGTISMELYDRDAPRTVANFFSYFQRYVGNGDGTIFHRIHKETGLNVLQGGANNFDDAGSGTINNTHIETAPPIRNEFSTDRPNTLGTIATAKTSDPDSATSEFFFNLDDANANTLSVGNSGGFTVFGKVLSDADLATLQDLFNSATAQNAGGFGELPLLSGTAVNTGNIERFISITTVFRDGELTYSITSSNTGVVTVTPTPDFQGTRPILVFVGAGTSTMTVTATDSTGQTASTTFQITVT